MNVEYRVTPAAGNEALNELFAAAWPGHTETDFRPMLTHSLAYVCAYAGPRLIGFVNLAWDGGIHAFLLDTTVHPEFQRRGIGQALVRHAIQVAKDRAVIWLHVDFEPHLLGFYRACGFRPTEAGLMHLPDTIPDD
jgi:ribosomal protein S18 acetylase RimI-like enzyme